MKNFTINKRGGFPHTMSLFKSHLCHKKIYIYNNKNKKINNCNNGKIFSHANKMRNSPPSQSSKLLKGFFQNLSSFSSLLYKSEEGFSQNIHRSAPEDKSIQNKMYLSQTAAFSLTQYPFL